MKTIRAITAGLALAAGILASQAGQVIERELVLTTGADSNGASSIYVDQAILERIRVDVVSTASTGTLNVAILGNTSTETTESLVSMVSSNSVDADLFPCRWYTTTAGTRAGVTNAPLPLLLYKNTITAYVDAVSTVATGKTWRVILRMIEQP